MSINYQETFKKMKENYPIQIHLPSPQARKSEDIKLPMINSPK